MKKNVIIIILSILLTGTLICFFVVLKDTKVNCINKVPCEKETISNWTILDGYTQKKYDYVNYYSLESDKDNENQNVPIDGVRIHSKEELMKYVNYYPDKETIINDFEKYDLENGTYILFLSSESSCGNDASGIKEVLVNGEFAVLSKDLSIYNLKNDNLVFCNSVAQNTYGIYIPMQISKFVIIQ